MSYVGCFITAIPCWKVDVRLPGARPVHLIITMLKWIRTSKSFKELSLLGDVDVVLLGVLRHRDPLALEREFFIDNLLVRIHFIIEMIWWTGLAPWEFECVHGSVG